MRCIVFGATGYLGSKLVKTLIDRGDEVLCVIRKNSNLSRLEAVKDRLRFCTVEELQTRLPEESAYDCMINLACRYPRNSGSDADMFEANFYQPLRVVIPCLTSGVKKFVTIGTGLPDTLNAYAMSKAKFAEVLKWYSEQYGQKGTPITVCNVELENFYGEDEPTDRFLPGTVAKLKRNEKILLTAGTQVRDFVYVDDVLCNLIKVLDDKNLPDYLNLPLGSGEGVSIRELITYLKELMQSDSELCFGAVPSRMNEPDSVANKEIMEQYGLTVRYDWKEGMKKFL